MAFLDPRESKGGAKITARLFVDAPGGPTRPVSTFRGEPRFFVILMDLVHEPLLGREQTKEQIREFMGNRFEGDELVSLLSYTGSLNLETPFTNDPEMLAAAVDAAFDRSRAPSQDPLRRVHALLRRLGTCLHEDAEGVAICVEQVSGSYQGEAETAEQEYLNVLSRAVDFAAGLSGRKALVVLSQGASLSPELELNAAVATVLGSQYTGIREGDTYGFDRIVSMALDRGVVLHFVSQPPSGMTRIGAASPSEAPVGADPLELVVQSAQEAMSLLAGETGGTHVVTEKASSGLGDVVSLERSGYTLGYYLERKKKDTRLHKVKIRCLRDGVRIVAPRGYRVEQPVIGNIAVKLHVAKPEDGSENGTFRIPFQIEADPSEIGYELRGGAATANFIIETSVYDDGGRMITRTFNLVNHAYDKEAWTNGVEPLRVNGWVELPPGGYELRALLRNLGNDNEGELTRRFTLGVEPTGS